MNQRNGLGDEHVERTSRSYDGGLALPAHPTTRVVAIEDTRARDAPRGEWTARPPGRLGRQVLADVERYLDFFAIARS
jgi:hypothetical protein